MAKIYFITGDPPSPRSSALLEVAIVNFRNRCTQALTAADGFFHAEHSKRERTVD